MLTSRLAFLPPWISHWLGYRAAPTPPIPPYLVWFWSFVAAFCGLAVVFAVLGSDYFQERQVPILLASYGASAVLVYGSPEAPLAQPRALIGGHFLSSLVGVCFVKLFELLPSETQFESLRWLAASLSTSIAIVVMQATKTTHPPAGATALLSAIDASVRSLSWYLLPVVLLSSMLMLATGLIIINLQRQYPTYWITPAATKTVSQTGSDSTTAV